MMWIFKDRAHCSQLSGYGWTSANDIRCKSTPMYTFLYESIPFPTASTLLKDVTRIWPTLSLRFIRLGLLIAIGTHFRLVSRTWHQLHWQQLSVDNRRMALAAEASRQSTLSGIPWQSWDSCVASNTAHTGDWFLGFWWGFNVVYALSLIDDIVGGLGYIESV